MFVGGKALAEQVTITFIPAETKATASATEVSKDGITLSVTAGTMNRDDNYRVNKGQTLTVTSTIGNIKQIMFTSTVEDPTANYGAKFDVEVGTFMSEGATGLWMGDAAEVKLTATDHQVRATEFVIVVDSNGSTPGGGDDPDPSTNDNLLAKFDYKSGTFSESADGNQITVDYVAVNAEAEISGKIIFDFENGLCTKCTVSALFPTEEMAKAYYDESLANKEKEGIETITIDGKTVTVTMIEGFNTLSKPVIKSMMKMMVDNEQGGLGTLDSPMTPNQANVFAGTLEKDETFDQDVYIKGKIASIKNAFDANYGTAVFFISADGQNDFTFQCYSVYYLENKKWVDGNTQINVGDEVIICGKVMNYKGNTPETASKKAYIYSLNGKTKDENGGDNPDPQVKTIKVAEALEIINALADGKTTSEEYIVKGIVSAVDEISVDYGNATFDIVDNANDQSALKVFRAKDAEGQKITNAEIVKVGDEVVVQGKLQKYVKNEVVTPEVASNGKILTVNGQSTGIEIIKVQPTTAVLYNLAGQRVDANYKGVVIKNGQKMIQK